jgi:poly(3-hydroxybutyrate) depolymerase
MPLVILCHGSDQRGAGFYAEVPATQRDLSVLANAGCVVIAIDHGDPFIPDNWGSDTAIARVDEAITWAATKFGCDTTRVGIQADSAGGPTALGWAWRNPSRLAGCIVKAGVVAIQLTYDRNVLLKALIEGAYGGAAAWTAAAPTHDPSHANQVASIQAINDRVLHMYSTGDGLILPSDVTALAASTGIQTMVFGNMAHDQTLMPPALPAEYMAKWMLDRF